VTAPRPGPHRRPRRRRAGPVALSPPVSSPITEYPCNGTTADNQLWWIEKQESGSYWIRNFASDNKCLDVAGFSDGGNDTNLTLYNCSTSDDQEWDIVSPKQS